MKPKSYMYVVVAIILIIIVVVLMRTSPSSPSAMNNGTYSGVNSGTHPVTPGTVQPAPQQPAAGYYQIHVVPNQTSIYYSSPATAQEIKISNPALNASITSPQILSGLASSTWYSQGVAPVLLTDTKGKILATGTVKAQGNPANSGPVAFLGTLVFPRQANASNGVLVFTGNNPSGANTRSVEILVKFK